MSRAAVVTNGGPRPTCDAKAGGSRVEPVNLQGERTCTDMAHPPEQQ